MAGSQLKSATQDWGYSKTLALQPPQQGFCSSLSFHAKQRSKDPNQSSVWSVFEMVGTGLVLICTRTTSPRDSSWRCLPSKQTHAGQRASPGILRSNDA